MTDQEKQDLARWLAEELEPEPLKLGLIECRLWVPTVGVLNTPKPATLNGNFAADVMNYMIRDHWAYRGRQGPEGLAQVEFFNFPQSSLGEHIDHVIAVCLAAKAALESEGGAE